MFVPLNLDVTANNAGVGQRTWDNDNNQAPAQANQLFWTGSDGIQPSGSPANNRRHSGPTSHGGNG